MKMIKETLHLTNDTQKPDRNVKIGLDDWETWSTSKDNFPH